MDWRGWEEGLEPGWSSMGHISSMGQRQGIGQREVLRGEITHVGGEWAVERACQVWLAEFGGGQNHALRQEAPENKAVDQGEEEGTAGACGTCQVKISTESGLRVRS